MKQQQIIVVQQIPKVDPASIEIKPEYFKLGGLLLLLGLMMVIGSLSSRKKGVLADAYFAGRREKLNAFIKARKQKKKRHKSKTALFAGDAGVEGKKVVLKSWVTGKLPSLPFPSLNQHLIALGSTGCGKTTTVVNRLIQDAIREGHPLIIFDPKGELAEVNAPYAQAFGYQDYYLAPGKKYTDCFNIVEWMRNQKDSVRAQQIAKTIQANSNPHGVSKTDPFFGASGEILVRSVLMLTRGTDYADLLMAKRILSLPELCDRIRIAQAKGKLDPWIENSFQQFISGKDAERTIAGIATTAGLVFDGFTQEEFLNAFMGKSTIPMDFTGKKILFVQPPIDTADIVMPVLTTAVEILVEENMSRPRNEPLLLFLEEFPLGYWRKCQQWMSYRRGDGLAVILIAQLFAQIRDRYGQDTALSILANANTQIYFNCNDMETAKAVSDRCGLKEVTYKQKSTSSGKSGNSYSKSEQRQKVPLITPDKLLQMGEGEFIMFNNGYGEDGKANIPVRKIYRIPKTTLDRDEELKVVWREITHPELCKKAEGRSLNELETVEALLDRGCEAESLLPDDGDTGAAEESMTVYGSLSHQKEEFADYV